MEGKVLPSGPVFMVRSRVKLMCVCVGERERESGRERGRECVKMLPSGPVFLVKG